jgi:hypothetical protein
MDLAIHPGMAMVGVPTNAKTVTIGLGFRLFGVDGLSNKGMFRGANKLVEKNRCAPIGKKTAHGSAFLRRVRVLIIF